MSKSKASLEEELAKRKKSIDNLQSNLKMGLQIERHLKKNIQFLERKQSKLVNAIKNGLLALRDYHNQQRSELLKILEDETSQMKLVLVEVQEKLNQIQTNSELKWKALDRGQQFVDAECRDVCIMSDADSDVLAEKSIVATSSIPMVRACDASDTLAQALQEKVSALLLLSQQEERHLLERDVNQVLQKKLEELKRNLSQVTNEKVQVLMELAQLKREYQQLQESINQVCKHRKSEGVCSEKNIPVHEQEGKLKYFLKRSYLKRWIGKGANEQEIDVHGSTDESSPTNRKNIPSADFARLKVENAALYESMANLEHLTSSIHQLRATLLKARDDAISDGPGESVAEALRSVIAEANHVKTALGCLLPVSWSTDAAVDAATYENLCEPTDPLEAIKDRVDPVSSAALEMVDLLILAAQLLLDSVTSSSTE